MDTVTLRNVYVVYVSVCLLPYAEEKLRDCTYIGLQTCTDIHDIHMGGAR